MTESTAQSLRAFELILEGFDGATDATDHLVVWIVAPSEAEVEVFIQTPAFRANHPAPVKSIHEMEGRSHLREEDGVDYVLPTSVFSPEFTKLLLEVRRRILAEPYEFDMNQWVARDESAPCGTTACIGGHMMAVKQGIKTLDRVFDTEDLVPDLTPTDHRSFPELVGDMPSRLFFACYWPEKLYDRWYDSLSLCSADRYRRRAKIAGDRILHFIETGE